MPLLQHGTRMAAKGYFGFRRHADRAPESIASSPLPPFWSAQLGVFQLPAGPGPLQKIHSGQKRSWSEVASTALTLGVHFTTDSSRNECEGCVRFGPILLKSRKYKGFENLAKFDFGAPPRLKCFAASMPSTTMLKFQNRAASIGQPRRRDRFLEQRLHRRRDVAVGGDSEIQARRRAALHIGRDLALKRRDPAVVPAVGR
jgi:hypothetical protein